MNLGTALPSEYSANKWVSQSCAERTSVAPKRGLASLAGNMLNMADSMEEVNVGGEKTQQIALLLRYISYANFVFANPLSSSGLPSRLFGSRNSRTTGILQTIRHVYRSVWPAREAKPRFGVALERSAHDCELAYWYFYFIFKPFIPGAPACTSWLHIRKTVLSCHVRETFPCLLMEKPASFVFQFLSKASKLLDEAVQQYPDFAKVRWFL